jgi:thymidine kinase
MDLRSRDGWIEVICGCMFAGKTEELIRRINRITYAKKTVIVFKPKIDNRYDEGSVVSHSQKKIKSIVISNASEILENLPKEMPYAIAVDEVQFFGEELIPVIESLANSGVRIICAGLDQDFRGEPFGIMPMILSRAEYVTKLQAICQVCGAPATRTQRIINGKPAKYTDPVVLVGAKEHYEARCRHCHQVEGKPVNE